jgi:hypothetical protein
MQTNKRPMLHNVIRLMDLLNDQLESFVLNVDNSLVLRHGAAKALTVLDKYYAKTDESVLYRAAMCMLLSISYVQTMFDHFFSVASEIQDSVLQKG